MVREVHQQVKACGGRKRLIPPRTRRVAAALSVLSHQELTPGAETTRETSPVEDKLAQQSAVKRRSCGGKKRESSNNLPTRFDHFGNRGVEIQPGDEAVRDAKESFGVLLGLVLQLAHGVHVGDGVYCRDTGSTT